MKIPRIQCQHKQNQKKIQCQEEEIDGAKPQNETDVGPNRQGFQNGNHYHQ